MSIFTQLRNEVKRQSHQWDMNDSIARGQIYRLLYGSRAVVEEVILQDDPSSWLAVRQVTEEPSSTPATTILGVTVHSGDILVSRGGAPTSALIARGNDYPGNFSHVALVHVDDVSGEASIVEAHIEVGVAIASLDQYLHDKKLRVLVLRPRADLLNLVADPMLPHKAATAAVNRARSEHIPYDFSMDYEDDSRLFCSEVASTAYRQFGVTLWMGISSISTPGIASWLAAFGVNHFETQEPSDLEYDPQLTVVAEWRDPETLWQDHVDNAIIDVMLEGAERGDRLIYDWYLLPFGRLAKAYSAVKNWFGAVGPVPEGMNASAALRNDNFSNRHARIKVRLLHLIRAVRDRERLPTAILVTGIAGSHSTEACRLDKPPSNQVALFVCNRMRLCYVTKVIRPNQVKSLRYRKFCPESLLRRESSPPHLLLDSVGRIIYISMRAYPA